jgi:hypothetical protein
MRGVRQLGVRNASRVHARGAHADLATVPPDVSQHYLGVVVALRHLLILLGAARGVPNQEDLHLLAFAFGQRTREA